MRFVDAHNHLHDERFQARQPNLIRDCLAAGIRAMVVNGSCEEDWPAVAALARAYPDVVIPSFGLHPWYVHQRSPAWLESLGRWLQETPGSCVGEIGLDRWILERSAPSPIRVSPGASCDRPAPLAEQSLVLGQQLDLAARLERPASLHCLKAWGPLLDCLHARPRPSAGFLLHSYGGSVELVEPFVRLGAYFSFPGYYLHARKSRQRDVFRAVPADRLLAETDAPDQRLPNPQDDPTAEWWPLDTVVREPCGPAGEPLNHPVNLVLVYRGLAALRGVTLESLAVSLEQNFQRLFRPVSDTASAG